MMGGVGARRLVPSLAAAFILVTTPISVGVSAADEVEVELVGFLGRLPDSGSRSLPPAGTTSRFEVPSEQGGVRQVFMVEFTARTELGPDTGRLRSGQLVILQGVLQGDRLRVTRVREIDVAEYGGRVSLPDGPLALPVTGDRTLNVQLDGSPSVSVSFLLMPRTASRLRSLRDGLSVVLTVVNGWRLVVGIEASR
jgi:hypothetical protein